MGIDVLLDKLHVVTQNGKYYRCFCPTHADTKPSLSVWIEDDGSIRIKCFAGCRSTQILDSLGLKWSDLNGNERQKRRFVCTYNYTDEDAKLLYQVVRFEPKSFAQRRPDGSGGWIWNLKGVRRVLYRLHTIVKSPPDEPIWFVEGEKDADRLAKEGLIATCIMGGSSAPVLDDYFQQITANGKRQVIYIIADADRPGRRFASDLAFKLAARECADSVVYVDLKPNVEDKSDVSDFLNDGHTVDELIELAEKSRRKAGILIASPAVNNACRDSCDSSLLDDVPF